MRGFPPIALRMTPFAPSTEAIALSFLVCHCVPLTKPHSNQFGPRCLLRASVQLTSNRIQVDTRIFFCEFRNGIGNALGRRLLELACARCGPSVALSRHLVRFAGAIAQPVRQFPERAIPSAL